MQDKLRDFRDLADKWTKDTHGKTVLWQSPNWALKVWFVAMVLAWLLSGRWGHLASQVSFGALFAWAWMEIFEGASIFRRGLGIIVLLLLLISALS